MPATPCCKQVIIRSLARLRLEKSWAFMNGLVSSSPGCRSQADAWLSSPSYYQKA
jgi:hypothetical protein